MSTLSQVERPLVRAGCRGCEERSHVFIREVCFEVSSPIGDQTVCGGVGLVERVVGEGNQDSPQGVDTVFREPVVEHSCLERFELFVEDLLLLLTHGAAQHVSLSQGVAGNLLGNLHNLLLVDDQTKCRAEDFF